MQLPKSIDLRDKNLGTRIEPCALRLGSSGGNFERGNKLSASFDAVPQIID